MIRSNMKNYSTILTEKLQNYEYLTGGEILPSNRRQIIQRAKVVYSTLRIPLEKRTKSIEDEGKSKLKP